MDHKLDEIDLRILAVLQTDASLSMDALADRVHLSRNACWRRVRQMEETGVIRARVALVDPEALGLGLSVLVMIRTNAHRPDWLDTFETTVRTMPEIIGAYRMTGDLDYVLRVRVADVRGYDRFYKRLIARVPLADISASFVMDEIKETTSLPLVPG
jgi:Lrp/AsnC family transcriptional regulator